MKTKTKKVTTTVEVYIADDGTEFDNEDDCRYYELKQIREKLDMYDYHLAKTNNTGCCRYVKLDTQEQVRDFIDSCKDAFVSTTGIERTGIYIYTEGTYGDRTTSWVNVTEVLSVINGGTNDQT